MTDSVNDNAEAISELNSNLEPTLLTVTYTTNSYCTSTALAACFAYKVGNILIFKFNLTLSSYPSGASYDNIEIGRISDWSTAQDTYYTIAPQNGTSAAGILLLRITRSGIIYMLNRSGTACVGYYRQVVVTPYE